jgi:hypothetical protein
MANGDAAAAAGLAVVAGTMDLRNGYDEINATRDMVANDKTTGTRRADQITSGVFPTARIPDLSGDKITSIVATAGNAGALSAGGIVLEPYTRPGYFRTSGGVYSDGAVFMPSARANGISGGLGLYVLADGRVGVSSSSRRFKKEIKTWNPNKQAVLAMEVITFKWRDDFWDGEGKSPIEVGLIAEDLHNLGLEWLVFYDDDGLPRGIHYDRIALALIPLIQDHEARLTALEKI